MGGSLIWCSAQRRGLGKKCRISLSETLMRILRPMPGGSESLKMVFRDVMEVTSSEFRGLPTFCAAKNWTGELIPGATRIDFALANPAGQLLVQRAGLIYNSPSTSGHAVLAVTLSAEPFVRQGTRMVMPGPLVDHWSPEAEDSLAENC